MSTEKIHALLREHASASLMVAKGGHRALRYGDIADHRIGEQTVAREVIALGGSYEHYEIPTSRGLMAGQNLVAPTGPRQEVVFQVPESFFAD
ncbi:hypothetical protein [Patulibacter medicamentivorans]|uniref:hypothetical protein n=1 Tax=Patulibacter medicamentivorans TaxID=1097667 RepID=UPI00058E8E11|nr:hypothetical protein [Patulibacter medicamentivorans]